MNLVQSFVKSLRQPKHGQWVKHLRAGAESFFFVNTYKVLSLFKFGLMYRGSPTYAVFTTANPTTTIFGLCARKWGIFALVGDPLQFY